MNRQSPKPKERETYVTESFSDLSLIHLVERSRRRDDYAFTTLVKQAWWRVMIHVVRGGIPGHDRDAVAFEVFQSLYEAILKSGAPDGSNPASFFAFLRTITRRRVVDYRRGLRPPPEGALREIAAARSATSDSSEKFEPKEMAAVEDCLGGLEEKRRYLVISHFFQGLSTRALERLTGTPASTIRLRIAEGLALLRDCLRSQGIDMESASGRVMAR